MGFLTDEAEVAALVEGTVLLDTDGHVVRAGADHDPDPEAANWRWYVPGNEEALSDRDVAQEGRWVVLRHGQHDRDAPLPTEGLDSFSTDGGMLSVRRTGVDEPLPVAMCISADWARGLAATLNAAEPAAYPAVVAAAQRMADLQAEMARQRKAAARLDEVTRERVAAILGVLGIGPTNKFGVGTTSALLAIRDRVQEMWRRDHDVTRAVLHSLASLWPDAPAAAADKPEQVIYRMAAEVRAQRELNALLAGQEAVSGVPAPSRNGLEREETRG